MAPPDFRGIVPTLILLGVLIGFVLFVGVPWLWRLARPWLLSVIA